MSRVLTIARRELRALLDHPTGYILIIVFLAVNNFLFFRQVFLIGAASLRPMLDLLPWILLFLVPAVTMRALADDTRTGVLEVVLAQPVTEFELVAGKYLGGLLFLWIALLLTLAVPAGLAIGADLPVGVIVAQYVGAMLLVAGLAAVGTWTSSLTRNQVTAFILGVAVMFLLVLVGLDPLIVGLPPVLGALAARLGVLSHFAGITRGVIDLRDAIYFVSLAGLFVVLAYAVVLGRRLPAASRPARRLQLGTVALVAAAVVVNLVGGSLGGRLDLTPGRAYTLSGATKSLVGNLDDLVTLKLFTSRELPPEISLLQRDVEDLLRDLRSAGRGNIRVVKLDPAGDSAAMREARTLGIPPIQFNVIGEAQLQIREGYMGLAIQYAEGQETVPVIQRTDDLEYRIVSAIRSMTRSARPVVGFVNDPMDEMVRQRSWQALRGELGRQYEVRTLTLADDTVPGPDVAVIVLAGARDSLADDQRARLADFLARGGGLLVMAGGMNIDPQQPYFAMPRPVAWNALLAPYGIRIRSDMVYDLLANESVSLPTQFGRLLTAYPFWLRAASTRMSVVNEEVPSLFLPWPSSIDTAGAVPGTVTPLVVSSEAAGISATQTLLDPQQQFRTDSLATRLLGVMVNPMAAAESVGLRGRLVVVANDDFASDRHARSAPENAVLALNAVDWLAQDEALIAIRSKDRRPPTLELTKRGRNGVKYANVVGIPVLVALAGLLRLLQRRRGMKRVYTRGKGA
ncbi:MAG: Gldg family protein [Gemmatimonadota bacterium]|nr:Gldg family protein [Gemmatimonadota bacterium]MDH5195765.1 Gldg family protein [Gemmatimonadota bacterium]